MKKLGLTGTRSQAKRTRKEPAVVSTIAGTKKRAAACTEENVEEDEGEGSVEVETPSKKVKTET